MFNFGGALWQNLEKALIAKAVSICQAYRSPKSVSFIYERRSVQHVARKVPIRNTNYAGIHPTIFEAQLL